MAKLPNWFGVIWMVTAFATYLAVAMVIFPSIQAFRMGDVFSGILLLVFGLCGAYGVCMFILGFILLGPSRVLDKFR